MGLHSPLKVEKLIFDFGKAFISIFLYWQNYKMGVGEGWVGHITDPTVVQVIVYIKDTINFVGTNFITH